MLAVRWLIREWRGGELGLLAAALIMAVGIVTGISGFTDRLHRGIEAESRRFLAADLVLRSKRAMPVELMEKASAQGLNSATVVRFSSMLFAGEQLQLVAAKAVSSAYPLRGELRISDQPFGADRKTDSVPAPGEIWLAPRLFALMDLEPGDSVGLGDRQMTVRAAVVDEPDKGAGLSSVGPSVMFNIADLDSTGLVREGSLVYYRYLFSGEAGDLAAFRRAVDQDIKANFQWTELNQEQPSISRSMDRARQFLLLAASFGVALAGIAVAIAARRYSERHFDSVAVLKATGASSRAILGLFASNLLMLTLITLVIGYVLGWGIQSLLLASLRDLMGFDAPAAGWQPAVAGAVTALVCSAAFALPPLMRLQNISPLRVLRRDLGGAEERLGVSVLIGVGGLLLLMTWYTGNIKLVLSVVAGLLLMMLLAAAAAWLLIRGTRQLGMQAGSVWRLAFSAIQRRARANVFQVVSFGLALMVMLSLATMRSSLLEEWQMQLPADAPNHFLLNISPDELEPLQTWLERQSAPAAGFYPMIRGRVESVNGVALADIPEVDSADSTVFREHNLSWAATLPEDNELVAGEWWRGTGVPQVSVEEDIARRSGLTVGDTVILDIAGEPVTIEVGSIRKLDWGNLRPNFFFLLEPRAVSDFNGNYITSFHLPRERKAVLNELIRQFPTVTLVEVDAVIRQSQQIIRQVSAALELVLALIVVCSLLVTVSNVLSSLDERMHENAILRAMGAERRLIAGSLRAEFAMLGAMAGVLAAAGTEMALWLVQSQVLEMPASLHPVVWLAGPIAGALLVAVTGWLTCRKVVNSPPLSVLREL